MLSVEELNDRLIDLSFAEDIGDGDHTTLCCIPDTEMGESKLLIKEEGIFAGVEIAKQVFHRFDPTMQVEVYIQDGVHVKPGDIVIAYESTPVLQIVGIGRVVSETDGEVLYIRKIEELLSPVPYSKILTNPILKNSEPVMNRCQGSLFRLTDDEYKEVMRLIRKENPEPIEEEDTEETQARKLKFLRQSQVKAANKAKKYPFAHPRFWAAFILLDATDK